MNSQPFQLQKILQNSSNTIVFSVVLLLHVLGLAWASQHFDTVIKPTVTPPSVVGFLVAPKPRPEANHEAKPKPITQPSQNIQNHTQPTVAKPASEQKVSHETLSATSPAPAEQTLPSAQATNSPATTPPATNPPPTQEKVEELIPPHTDAVHLNNPTPQYPALSRRLGEEGKVLLDVYILPNGNVGEIKLKKSSGFTRLDDSALLTVKSWKYVPAKRGVKPIAFWYVQPISFVLNN